MTNLLQRCITGILFVAVLVGAILCNVVTFSILFMAISALTIGEFVGLVNQHEGVQVSKLITMLGGCYLFVAMLAVSLHICGIEAFLPYLLVWLYLLIRELYLCRPNPLANWAYTALSQLYIALPFALLNMLAINRSIASPWLPEYYAIIPLSLFIFIWVNDSAAFWVGCTWGKHRLFLRISPKKSWEGAFGGAFFTLLAAAFIGYYYPQIMPLWAWIGFGLVTVVFSIWGDLVESLFKRHLDIKDSGSILPGHGGWLDRFDSALLAIPAAVVYLYIVRVFLAL